MGRTGCSQAEAFAWAEHQLGEHDGCPRGCLTTKKRGGFERDVRAELKAVWLACPFQAWAGSASEYGWTVGVGVEVENRRSSTSQGLPLREPISRVDGVGAAAQSRRASLESPTRAGQQRALAPCVRRCGGRGRQGAGEGVWFEQAHGASVCGASHVTCC